MEIEIRAFVDDFKDLEKHLKKIKAKKLKKQRIIDYWFCPKNYKTFKQISMHKPGSYSLRIRCMKEGRKEYLELNTKAIATEGDHNAFIEHETTIDSVEECREILETIGFKIFCVIDKQRTVYQKKNMLINLEDIKGFDPTVEVEIISDVEEEIHKKTITQLLKQIGIKEKNIIKTSITNLFMKKYAFKQKF